MCRCNFCFNLQIDKIIFYNFNNLTDEELGQTYIEDVIKIYEQVSNDLIEVIKKNKQFFMDHYCNEFY